MEISTVVSSTTFVFPTLSYGHHSRLLSATV